MKNKDIEDSGSWHEEPIFSDENSDSSGDILPLPSDIKKMVPYDQRKELGLPIDPEVNSKKLNIMYDELEDSGSEGSGIINKDDPNHLASIIEEEEEATEYQRSRSRSKNESPIPGPTNLKTTTVGGNDKQKESELKLNNMKEAKLDDSPVQLPKDKSQKEEKIEIKQPEKAPFTQKRKKSQLSARTTKKEESKSKAKGDKNINKKSTEKKQGKKASKVAKDDDRLESQSMKNPVINDDKHSEIHGSHQDKI